jgi:hypothetical protein
MPSRHYGSIVRIVALFNVDYRGRVYRGVVGLGFGFDAKMFENGIACSKHQSSRYKLLFCFSWKWTNEICILS